ncbi:MAG: branched-chain amino acid transport system ATP-binding protein [Thermodesulfobacteriota bacterium]|nr:branched-chain amino acid transport system ATP-binding protein [Thermodesulfobacteriota bacterium]
MLTVKEVDSFYGLSHVLHGVSFNINPGETVSLLGRNGAGKSTTLHSIMGIHRNPLPKGSIIFEGDELIGCPPHRIMRRGVSLVPEGREVFPLLSVIENIKIGHLAKKNDPGHWSFDAYLETVCNLFPVLGKRLKNKGSQLSGGEQQMLAMARALGSKPRLLMLDEPTEGLAPMIIEKICESIVELQRQQVAMLLVTHGTKLATDVSKRIFFLEKGKICYQGTSQEVVEHPEVRRKYLGV